MRIEIPSLVKTVRADSIGIGQCFLCGEELCMRTNGSFSGERAGITANRGQQEI